VENQTPAEPAADSADEEEDLPHCKCGTNRLSKFSVVNRDYTFLGQLYLIWGGTSVPAKVSFRCVKCGAMFDSSTAPSVCRQHTT
jgi:hypothetical protein